MGGLEFTVAYRMALQNMPNTPPRRSRICLSREMKSQNEEHKISVQNNCVMQVLQTHPPTRNSNAKLLFAWWWMLPNSSLFCRFCSQPVPSCCFVNFSFMCWLHHLLMTPVVPSLHLYGTSNLSDFSQRWEGGAEIPQRWSFGPITAVSHPPPIQTAFLLFCISC